jgi:3-isopropylmalate/(R)-2-methylmalate dehydratase small subunit
MTAIAGRVWKFGDNISADNGIIQYSQVPDLGSFDIPALKAMCFVLIEPDFPRKVRAGDVIVAGSNFGHHSHPHACVAMIESGVSACLCESTDSAFVRKALNVGLPVIPCPGISAIVECGDWLSADLAAGQVRNLTTSEACTFRPFCAEMLEVWQAGGLAPALRRRVAALNRAAPESPQ